MEDDSLLLRAATEADGAAIEHLAREAGLSFLASRDFGHPHGIILVAVRADAVVAFLAAQIAVDEAEILDVAVTSAERRRGIGGRLVTEFAKQARACGVTRLLLEVRRSNLAAIRLYEGVGFVQVGERLRYYREGEDALLLTCELEVVK